MSATQVALNDHIEATLIANRFYGLIVTGGRGGATGAVVEPVKNDPDTLRMLGKAGAALERGGLIVEPRAEGLYVMTGTAKEASQ